MERGDIKKIHTGCEEIRSIEMEEDGVAVDQDEENCPKDTPVSKIRLQTIGIGILRQIVPLC